MIGATLNHLWQSTLCALLIGALTLAFQNTRANIRFGMWCAASLKFLIPFSLLISLGEGLRGAMPPISAIAPYWGIAAAPASIAPAGMTTVFLIMVWTSGAVTLVLRWVREWQKIRQALALSRPLAHSAPVPIRATSAKLAPGLFGLIRPTLILPEEVLSRLSEDQLASVIEHEICHWRRRDNLTALPQMVVELVFWFHPLIWWLGARLLSEREKACDEAVIFAGRDRRTYAEGILEICKLQLAQPLACSPGVSGGDLKDRITHIMESPNMTSVHLTQKFLLTGLACAVVIGPVIAGVSFGSRVLADVPPGTAPVIQAASCSGPAYPAEELKKGTEGVVAFSLLIGTDGLVKGTKIRQSSGSKALDSAAVEAMSKCRFTPGRSAADGVPLETWADLKYSWKVG